MTEQEKKGKSINSMKTTLGMIVAPHPVAAKAGLEMLRAGGNAFDAVVAAAFAEAVVEPTHNGIAGYGGCLVGYQSTEEKVVAVDYNTRAPAAASADMFSVKPTANGKYTVPGHIHSRGPLSVGVPGIVAGLSFALEKLGTLSLSEVVQPAIKVAQDGFTVNRQTASNINDLAQELSSHFPDTAKLLMRNGVPPGRGDRLHFPELAQTLSQIAKEGDETFYRGEIAHRIVTSLKYQGGILTSQDLTDYKPRLVKPLKVRYRDYTIYTPPICAGGHTTLQMLKVLDTFGLSEMKPGSPELYHLLIEVMKVCWEERLTKLGDPEFVKINQETELEDERIKAICLRVKKGLEHPKPGRVISPEPFSCTSHLCAADAKGNIVSLTQTHGAPCGSLVSIPGTGLILGHGVGRFDPRPGWPNSIAPGKQPLHNMSPLLILKDGYPFAAVGTPGGRTIINNNVHFIISLIDFGLNITKALAMPRLHCETSEPVQLEKEVKNNVLEGLRRLGHRLTTVDIIGGPAHGIVLEKAISEYDGATDPRWEGEVVAT